MVRLDNSNKDKGVYYDDVNLTFYDSPNKSQPHLIGNYTIPRFYQGHQKKAKKDGHTAVNMTLVSRVVAPNGTAEFWVDLATAVRFKILWWKTKKHSLIRSGSVLVDETGAKGKKGIKLRSGAPERGNYCALVGVLVSLLVLLTWLAQFSDVSDYFKVFDVSILYGQFVTDIVDFSEMIFAILVNFVLFVADLIYNLSNGNEYYLY